MFNDLLFINKFIKEKAPFHRKNRAILVNVEGALEDVSCGGFDRDNKAAAP